MAHYIPDNKYIKGKELVENLPGEEGELIRYYISEKDKHTQSLNKIIDEMQQVFKGISRFAR